MEKLIFNENKLEEKDINRIVIRSKALIINSNYMCLLGYSHGCYQLIGGHKEENETLEECLVREVKEETGIELKLEKRVPYFILTYYCKDYPEAGINSKYIINYFNVETDLKPDLDKVDLTEDEKEGLFEFRYIQLSKLESEMFKNLEETNHSNVVRDSIEAVKTYIKYKNNKIKEKSCGAIVINNDKVLLIEQKQGFYGFPKGHVEGSETEIETALRETKEETNIDVEIDSNLRYSIEYDLDETRIKESVFFVATPTSLNIIKQESEINNIEWVDIDEVYDKLTFDNTKEMWIKVRKDINSRFLSVFDDNDKLLKEKISRKDKLNLEDGKNFRIVLIYIKNSEDKYLIQKCSKEKGEVYATCGGHVDYGNSSIETALIELEEEMGIKISQEELKLLKIYKNEKTFCDVYLLEKDIDINNLKLQKEEVEDVYWLSKEEISNLINEGKFRKGNIESFKEFML